MRQAESRTPSSLLTTSIGMLTALFVAACGPTYEAADAPVERTERRTAEMVEVEIVNNLEAAGDAEVYAMPESGARNFLALAGAEETTTIEFAPTPAPEERYRLIAVMGGEEIESESFVPPTAGRVIWDLESNRVTTEPGENEEERDA